MPLQKKKQSKLKKLLGFFNPKTLKGGVALFALVFAIGGGVYFVYRSFAATGGAGGYHTCWIKTSDATLWCWGKNDAGQLGLGDTTNRAVPTKVNITDVVAVTTGILHTCAKKVDSSLWCWGDNKYGQLGVGYDSSASARLLPTRVNLDNIAQISAGGYHTCASKIDGTLWCWGDNKYGQLGVGSFDNTSTPRQLYFGSVLKLSAGGYHTCATMTNGSLWCWGGNQWGQLGIGSTTNTSTPKQLFFDKTAEISAGNMSTCASRTDGSLWCWGGNNTGQLGIGSTTNTSTPKQLFFDKTAQIALGNYTNCASRTDGSLWCWGGGSSVYKKTPTQLYFANTYQISSGGTHNCASKTDGSLWCWGSNVYGQLGIGSTADKSAPAQLYFLWR